MPKRNTMGAGESLHNFAGDTVERKESPVFCAYGDCGKQIPNGTALKSHDEKYFCSEGCFALCVIKNHAYMAGSAVTIQYVKKRD